MKYTKPTYISEKIETSDIILTSLEGGATITEVDSTTAKVGVSALDVLGLR